MDTKNEDDDVYVLRVKQLVSLKPLSLDFTTRMDLEGLNRLPRSDD